MYLTELEKTIKNWICEYNFIPQENIWNNFDQIDMIFPKNYINNGAEVL